MTLRGHVKDGVVVFDEPVSVQDGAIVRIEFLAPVADAAPYLKYRGTPYVYTDPFGPAVPLEYWNDSN